MTLTLQNGEKGVVLLENSTLVRNLEQPISQLTNSQKWVLPKNRFVKLSEDPQSFVHKDTPYYVITAEEPVQLDDGLQATKWFVKMDACAIVTRDFHAPSQYNRAQPLTLLPPVPVSANV